MVKLLPMGLKSDAKSWCAPRIPWIKLVQQVSQYAHNCGANKQKATESYSNPTDSEKVRIER